VSGVHEGDEYSRYGHTRLAKVVKEMYGSELDPTTFPKVEMQVDTRLSELTALRLILL
jgi:hypothetical protein